MKRIQQIVHVKPECLEKYIELHDKIWPEVVEAIHKAHLQNYSISQRDDILFAHFEYFGDNFDEDMRIMAENPSIQDWWAVCKPCLYPVKSEKESDCWANMREIFFLK